MRWSVAATPQSWLATEVQPFRAPLLSGGEIELGAASDHRPVVLVFWASWCAPCVEEAPHLERLHTQHGSSIRFVSVSIDETNARDDLRRVVAERGITYPVALDPEGGLVLPKYARGIGIPLTFVIGADGKVRVTQRNYQAGDERALERAILDAIDGGSAR